MKFVYKSELHQTMSGIIGTEGYMLYRVFPDVIKNLSTEKWSFFQFLLT